jgi:hypothetical protein
MERSISETVKLKCQVAISIGKISWMMSR